MTFRFRIGQEILFDMCRATILSIFIRGIMYSTEKDCMFSDAEHSRENFVYELLFSFALVYRTSAI